jgi:hypothetical protein
MSKRPKTKPAASNASREPAGRRPRPDIVHTSLYLPATVHEALREIAFHERLKIHDVVMQGIDAALRKRGYPPISNVGTGKKG